MPSDELTHAERTAILARAEQRRKHSPPLRRLRRARELSQVELAKLSGVRQQTICEIEAGRILQPWWPTIYRLAKALGVEPDELFPVTASHVPESGRHHVVNRDRSAAREPRDAAASHDVE